jgi:hypothetical protein
VLKSFACRQLLLRLEQLGELVLPPLRVECRPRRPWSLGPVENASPPEAPLVSTLEAASPLRWVQARPGSAERSRALGWLRHQHYLGLDRPVGSHLLYLVQDRHGRDLAVHLVGAAAWQCAPRDRFIGWNLHPRRQHLERVANHSRFLVLPWVRIDQLASHLLAGLRHRIAADWLKAHGHRLALLESFVEERRFRAIAYRADNWQCVGRTQGRTRQEKAHVAVACLKSVWLHPLRPDFRRELGVELAREVA